MSVFYIYIHILLPQSYKLHCLMWWYLVCLCRSCLPCDWGQGDDSWDIFPPTNSLRALGFAVNFSLNIHFPLAKLNIIKLMVCKIIHINIVTCAAVINWCWMNTMNLIILVYHDLFIELWYKISYISLSF